MSRRLGGAPIGTSLVAVAALMLASCGEPTRIATLNQTTRIPGARAAATVQAKLADHGYPNATVSCAKTIIVNVGPAVSCKLTGAGANGTVQFRFRTLDGQVNLASVTAK